VRRRSSAGGYFLIDVVVALGLFSFVVLWIYRMFGPTFALYQGITSRLSADEDVRLALDRVARALHETTTASGRLKVYAAADGCSIVYEGCLAFVTARDADCRGAFQLINGAPNWQATLYVWRDTGSKELRLRCESGTTFPTDKWPPPHLEPWVVIGTHVVAARITAQPGGSPRPTSIGISLEEEARAPSAQAPVALFNETVILPQNR
jgi:hypothetical protein